MNNCSEEHLRHRREYQKKYMPEYRARKRAERAAQDPEFAERSRKYQAGRSEQASMTPEQKAFRALEYSRVWLLGYYRDQAALRAATDIDFALRSARTRAGIEATRHMTDTELAEHKRQKKLVANLSEKRLASRREYQKKYARKKRALKKQTKQEERSRACQQPSEQTRCAVSGCIAEL